MTHQQTTAWETNICARRLSELWFLRSWSWRLCCQVAAAKITSHTRLHIGHQYTHKYALIHQINAFPSHSQRSPPAERSTGRHSSKLDMSVGDFTMVQQANILPLRPLGQTQHQAEGLYEWLLMPFVTCFFVFFNVYSYTFPVHQGAVLLLCFHLYREFYPIHLQMHISVISLAKRGENMFLTLVSMSWQLIACQLKKHTGKKVSGTTK